MPCHSNEKGFISSPFNAMLEEKASTYFSSLKSTTCRLIYVHNGDISRLWKSITEKSKVSKLLMVIGSDRTNWRSCTNVLLAQ